MRISTTENPRTSRSLLLPLVLLVPLVNVTPFIEVASRIEKTSGSNDHLLSKRHSTWVESS